MSEVQSRSAKERYARMTPEQRTAHRQAIAAGVRQALAEGRGNRLPLEPAEREDYIAIMRKCGVREATRFARSILENRS